MKIRFRSQVAAEETPSKSRKLAKLEEYKQVWIKKKKIEPEKRDILEIN